MRTQAKARCAVCGGKIENVVRQSSSSEEYHLCSQDCRTEFLVEPSKYEKVWFYFRKHGIDSNFIKCAVCGDNITEEVAVTQEYFDKKHLKHFFFCTEPHRVKFINNPKEYKDNSGMNITA